MSAAEVYQTVSTAWTERRLENVLERQKQLAALHSNVKAQNEALTSAIEQDLSVTRANAAEEVRVVLDAVKSLYDELDFPATLRQEQMIKKGSSVSQNLVEIGPSLIEPTASCPLASSLVPLAASVAAGSATILLLNPTTPTTNTLLQKLVHDSFDYEAIAVAPDSSTETKQHLSSRYFAVAVLQDLQSTRETAESLTSANPTIRILEPSTGLPAVFVDRSTSDLQAVAAHINRSIIKPTRQNTSRVPHLCFVDESIIDKLEALLRTREQGPLSDAPEKDVDIFQGLQRSLKTLFPATFKQHRSRSLPALISLSNSE
ncbi:hypothetical protein LTR10_022449 [Elasticomyces elasticus]|uniref:Aldehyde dehydrogenase domain-containing protein n=1 Tax=Exophiala sideris TaxID=1016849 RepID=A0ABR0J2X5_9EURO|nr:hypothetical protein LTR10_022449 [Elasticomyces elasticus]KAK5024885.1 hypothetical protein LTS07_008263 [Exophiala sideris]KAK5031525.1 hypothetical protein LTR13_007853 [Exophiala sideris]KAK5054924.1 hypothetical protein LTR69_008492 [Exophiala sideris]KAK5179803.1 hypothetical protein LTR44_007619 [Eurotiomycetes sp. CCFEE 6388]